MVADDVGVDPYTLSLQILSLLCMLCMYEGRGLQENRAERPPRQSNISVLQQTRLLTQQDAGGGVLLQSRELFY